MSLTATKPPVIGLPRQILVEVQSFEADGQKFIIVSKFGKPSLLVDNQGNGRLIRKDQRDTYGQRHVYVNKRIIPNLDTDDLPGLIRTWENALVQIAEDL